MTTLEVLQAARALISDPGRWAQHYWAFDAQGVKTEADQPEAVRWCAAGACYAQTASDYEYRVDAVMRLDQLTGGRLFIFNDSHSHADVLALYDRAIARLQCEAAL